MKKRSETVLLSRDERLRESKRQPTSMSLPLAVHHYLDLLAECAADVEATRGEIIGMVLAETPLDSADLERRILRYRKLKVGDVLPDEPDEGDVHEPSTEENVVSITKRGPGRPSRREAG